MASYLKGDNLQPTVYELEHVRRPVKRVSTTSQASYTTSARFPQRSENGARNKIKTAEPAAHPVTRALLTRPRPCNAIAI